MTDQIERGEVRVTARVVEPLKSRVKLEFEVSDSGIGMRSEDIPRALEAEILRLHQTEHWPIGTIATQLRVHHGTVRRVQMFHLTTAHPHAAKLADVLKRAATRIEQAVPAGGPDHGGGLAGEQEGGGAPIDLVATPRSGDGDLVAFRLNRTLGWILTGFALVIGFGSVHLGWHYALDGIVAAFAAWGIWWVAGRCTQWLMAERRQAEAPIPATA
mgnify:CR=1 FL=1